MGFEQTVEQVDDALIVGALHGVGNHVREDAAFGNRFRISAVNLFGDVGLGVIVPETFALAIIVNGQLRGANTLTKRRCGEVGMPS